MLPVALQRTPLTVDKSLFKAVKKIMVSEEALNESKLDMLNTAVKKL